MGLGATHMHYLFFSFCDSDFNWIITNQIGACNHLGTWCALLCIHLFTRPYNVHAAQTANFAGVKKLLFRSYNLLRKIQASKIEAQPYLGRTKLFLWLSTFVYNWKKICKRKKVHQWGNETIKGILIPIILSLPIAAQTTISLHYLKLKTKNIEHDLALFGRF